MVVGICCGLCFGIFAGLGFQAVNTASELLKETAEKQIKEIGAAQEEQVVDETEVTEAPAATQAPVIAQTGQTNDTAQVVQTNVMNVSDVVKEVMPAVVSVNNKYVEKMSFFGQSYSSEANSCGSGIIVGQNETELLLVSNHHVVASAEELTVQFIDGSQVQAQIKGTDEEKDLAVIAVQLADISDETREQIAVAKMGDSDSLTVGEPVIAIGNALGYGQSVTTGVVSALNRPIGTAQEISAQENTDAEINTFIQTDAAINPGNSGGALLNIRGEVIGINSNKIGGSAVEGMGYAIPISDAEPIIEDLMTKETRVKVDSDKRGYLGITGVDVVAEYSEIYGMPQGVYVSSVMDGTGAADAGLIKGDIITAINGEEITSMSELKEELCYYAAGTTVELTIMQGSPTGYQAKTVNVKLGTQSKTQ
ncbi:MAG: trypsin-like peptidase domain-containing protein [Bacillota bacterium]|nr:trypsin-like peptidase domain-containing protein [Bacillota bacterium]